jgi:hypothetical protein
MMNTYLVYSQFGYELTKLQHEDRLKQAAQTRLIQLAMQNRTVRPSLWERLRNLGWRKPDHRPLVARHAVAAALTVLVLLVNTLPAAADDIYLPLVSHQVQEAASGISNGSFEAGATVWTAKSNHGRTVIRNSFGAGVTARSGSYATWMGFYALEVSTIQQQATVPSDQPYLAYWHWIVSEDQCLRDKVTVLVNNSEVDSYLLCAPSQTNGWANHVVNLAAYAGQTVTLTIQVKTDADRASNLYLDDMGFQANGS